MEKVSVMA